MLRPRSNRHQAAPTAMSAPPTEPEANPNGQSHCATATVANADQIAPRMGSILGPLPAPRKVDARSGQEVYRG